MPKDLRLSDVREKEAWHESIYLFDLVYVEYWDKDHLSWQSAAIANSFAQTQSACLCWGMCGLRELSERGCCATPVCEQWISYVYVSLFLCQKQNQYNFESITSITVVKQEARGAAVVSTYSCWITFPATQDKPLVVLTYGKYVGWITQSQLVIRAPATLSTTRVQLHNNTDI